MSDGANAEAVPDALRRGVTLDSVEVSRTSVASPALPPIGGSVRPRRGVLRRAVLLVGALLVGAPLQRIASQEPVPGVTLAAGTSLSVRLLDPVVGTRAFQSTPVRALVIAPAAGSGVPTLVAGDTLWGSVRDAGVTHQDGRRHFVALAFDRVALVDGSTSDAAFLALVADVPNARERVDDRGRIVGPARPGLLRWRVSWAAAALGVTDAAVAGIAFGALAASRLARHAHVAYAAGVEMTLTLVDPVMFPERTPSSRMPEVPADVSATLLQMPRFVSTRKERLPADPFTLALVGSEADVATAFTAAGWTVPARSKLRGDLSTLLAAVRGRGFESQPFTVLQLDGRPPALAFQKVVNTMLKRDHLRIWQWGVANDGRPVWLVAATRDVGLAFSRPRRAFTHLVDPDVDVVRDKIATDLIAAGRVAARTEMLLPPLTTPLRLNDGATPVRTDGRLIALDLVSGRHAPAPAGADHVAVP